MATTVTVSYEGDRTETITVLPIGLVIAERHFKGSLPPVEGTLYAAWACLKPGIGFEQWLGSLTAISEKQDDSDPLAEEPSPAP